METKGNDKMTNPISKAIVKAAVAMGYGKKSDYKGSSVADVLEKFASIAKDKGSSGGTVYAFFTERSGTWTCNKTVAELKAAWDAGNTIFAFIEGTWFVPMIMLNYGFIQAFHCSDISVNQISMQDKIRIDTIELDYYTENGNDAVEFKHKTWQVSATVYNG
jgi:sugar phosphate isomerase/epimerase